jgi:hypothetical protein
MHIISDGKSRMEINEYDRKRVEVTEDDSTIPLETIEDEEVTTGRKQVT